MLNQIPNLQPDEVIKYLRKSRSDDPLLTVEEVLQKHDSLLNEFSLDRLGFIVPEHLTFREVASSETINDRPEMCRLLKEIESPKIKAVMVKEIERLSRGDLMDAGLLMRIFRFTNTLIITPTEVYDLRNEVDRMIAEMRLKSGNQYLEYSKKVMKLGKDIAAKNGEYISRLAPLGYEKTSYKEGRRTIKTLEINEEEAKIVRLVFESYADMGMSMGEIADMLNETKAKKKTDSPWTRGTIAEIIMNPVYYGKVRWNYRTNVKSWENQQMSVSRPRRSADEYVLVDGLHEAIITEDLYIKANERKSQNVPIKKSNDLKNPLAGIFYCAKCGKAMRLKPGDKRNKARFECSGLKYCGCASAYYSDVIDEICKALEDYIGDFEVLVSNDNSDEIDRHKQMVEMLEKRLAINEKKELSLWDKYAEEGMPKSIFDKLMDEVLKDKKELKESLGKAYASTPRQEDYEEKIFTFKQAMESIRDDKVSAKAKNTYLRGIIQEITYSREKGVLLTKDLAEKMGVPYPHRLAWHNYPFELDITLH